MPNTTVLVVEQKARSPVTLLETASRPLISKTAMYEEGSYCVEDYDTVRVWMQRFGEHRSTGSHYIVDIDYTEGIEALLSRVIFSGRCFFKQNKTHDLKSKRLLLLRSA